MIGLKVLATIALVCTVVLWCGLWGASATPHDKSKVDTQEVTDKIDAELFGLFKNENNPSILLFSIS